MSIPQHEKSTFFIDWPEIWVREFAEAANRHAGGHRFPFACHHVPVSAGGQALFDKGPLCVVMPAWCEVPLDTKSCPDILEFEIKSQ
jgi:hypothetical protein